MTTICLFQAFWKSKNATKGNEDNYVHPQLAQHVHKTIYRNLIASRFPCFLIVQSIQHNDQYTKAKMENDWTPVNLPNVEFSLD